MGLAAGRGRLGLAGAGCKMSDAGPFPQTTSAPRLPKPELLPPITTLAPAPSSPRHGADTRAGTGQGPQGWDLLRSGRASQSVPSMGWGARGVPKSRGDAGACSHPGASPSDPKRGGPHGAAPNCRVIPAGHRGSGRCWGHTFCVGEDAAWLQNPSIPLQVSRGVLLPNITGGETHPRGRNRPQKAGKWGAPSFHRARGAGIPLGRVWGRGGCSHACSTWHRGGAARALPSPREPVQLLPRDVFPTEPPPEHGAPAGPGWARWGGEERGGPGWGNWERRT